MQMKEHKRYVSGQQPRSNHVLFSVFQRHDALMLICTNKLGCMQCRNGLAATEYYSSLQKITDSETCKKEGSTFNFPCHATYALLPPILSPPPSSLSGLALLTSWSQEARAASENRMKPARYRQRCACRSSTTAAAAVTCSRFKRCSPSTNRKLHNGIGNCHCHATPLSC